MPNGDRVRENVLKPDNDKFSAVKDNDIPPKPCMPNKKKVKYPCMPDGDRVRENVFKPDNDNSPQ